LVTAKLSILFLGWGGTVMQQMSGVQASKVAPLSHLQDLRVENGEQPAVSNINNTSWNLGRLTELSLVYISKTYSN
jgi:hypothetical protein